MTTIQSRNGDMLDAVVHRFYGRTDGTIEFVLEENPSLAQSGPVLTTGQKIHAPPLPPTAAEEQQTIKLWGV